MEKKSLSISYPYYPLINCLMDNMDNECFQDECIKNFPSTENKSKRRLQPPPPLPPSFATHFLLMPHILYMSLFTNIAWMLNTCTFWGLQIMRKNRNNSFRACAEKTIEYTCPFACLNTFDIKVYIFYITSFLKFLQPSRHRIQNNNVKTTQKNIFSTASSLLCYGVREMSFYRLLTSWCCRV